jgi:RNA 3'-terminal phosphate cyclase (ATP)
LGILRDAGYKAQIEIAEAPSIGQGTFFFLLAEFEGSRAGFDSLGERSKRAEVVAEEACGELIDFLRGSAAIDKALADQIAHYLALSDGGSEFVAHEVTEHLLTNIWVVEQFLPLKFSLDRESGRARVKGIGFKK